MVDPDSRLGGTNFICFAVSHVNFFIGGSKSIAKLDEGHGRIFPRIRHCLQQYLKSGYSRKICLKMLRICQIIHW